MIDPQIEKLLILQESDIKLQKIEQELARLPKEKAAYEQKIESERAAIETARQSLHALEVQCKELNSRAQALEADVQKFRNQQLEVKKNEEYRALTLQIEQSQQLISEAEEEEIGLMLEIDVAKAAFEEEKIQIESRIREQEKFISLLAEKKQVLAASIDSVRQELAASRENADAEYLEHYDRVRKLTKRPPYVVPVQSQICGGCHLRVSNEVAHAAAGAGEPHFCDQCGRIVYLAS